MEKYVELHNSASKDLQKAGHFLYVTFNLVQESKILTLVIEQINSAIDKALESLLEFERTNKNIEPFPRHVPMMISIYEKKIQERRELNPKFLQLVRKLKVLKSHINESSMTFRRNDKFVFATDTYETKSIDLDLIKKYYNISNEFILRIGDIIK